MSNLLRNHWLHRSLFAGLLIAFGVGIYHLQPPAPMCVIAYEGKAVPLCLAAGGRRLVTTAKRQTDPLIVWDTRTGLEILRLPNKGQKPRVILTAFSQDGRYVAAEIRESGNDEDEKDFHSIFLVDTLADTVREIPLLVGLLTAEGLRFSPKGDLLLRWQWPEENVLRIWDTSTGALVDQRPIGANAETLGDFFLHTITGKAGNAAIELWSMRQRKPLATLENVGWNGGYGRAGHYFVSPRWNADERVASTCGIWSLKTFHLEAEFDTKAAGFCTLSNDGRWLADKGQDANGAYVELRALPSGKLAGSFRAVGFNFDWMTFSPDGQFLFVADVSHQLSLALLDTPGMNVLWTQTTQNLQGYHFSPDSRTIFFLTDPPGTLTCLDCATGTQQARIVVGATNMFYTSSLQATPDGRTLLVHHASQASPVWTEWLQKIPWLNWPAPTQTDTIVIVDAESCHERFRLRSGATASFLLSDEGRTLATLCDAPGGGRDIYCWDVDARKPLHWAIGVPAALAALVTPLTWWRRRRALSPN